MEISSDASQKPPSRRSLFWQLGVNDRLHEAMEWLMSKMRPPLNK